MTQIAQGTAREAATGNTYTVASGDTGWSIAKKSLPKDASNPQITAMLKHIKELNPRANLDKLSVGQHLILPASDELKKSSVDAANFRQERRTEQSSNFTHSNKPAAQERYSRKEVEQTVDGKVREAHPVEAARCVLNKLPEEDCRRLEAKLKAGGSNAHPALLLAGELEAMGIGKSGPVPDLNPADVYDAVTINWYNRIIHAKNIGPLETGPGQLTVIGLRGFDLDKGRHDNAFIRDFNGSRTGNQYNDTICFIYRNKAGNWELLECRATTDPGMRYGLKDSKVGEDVNSDGRKDIAWLPGNTRYEYVPGPHKTNPGAARPKGDIVPVYRDVDASGSISPSEEAYSEKLKLKGLALNIHAGTKGTFVGNNSAGCQVINMGWDEFHEKITPFFNKDSDRNFPYLLVDVGLKKRTDS